MNTAENYVNKSVGFLDYVNDSLHLVCETPTGPATLQCECI